MIILDYCSRLSVVTRVCRSGSQEIKSERKKHDDRTEVRKGKDGFSHAKRASEYEFVKELAEEGVALGDMWYSKYFG